MPKLAIGGLGISTLAKDGGKTAEELGDMKALMDAKNQKLKKDETSSEDS
jgi:hypothetical protein